MEGANTLAYYNMETITAVKSFIVQAHVGLFNETFYGRNYFRTLVS